MTFLSELRGRPVFDAEGRRIGALHDVLVSPELPYPPVESVVVDARHRRFSVPWDQIAAIAPNGASLRSNAPPDGFGEPNEGLLWLGRDVMDKQIVDISGVKLVRVNDVALTSLNDELRVAGVDNSTAGLLRRLGLGRFARRPPLIDWEQVDIGPAVREVRLKVAYDGLRRMHPSDIAHIAEQMSPADAADVFEELDDETAAAALAELSDERVVAVIAHMDPEEAADVLEEMDPDDAADVLGEVDEQRAAELMARMDPEAAADVRTLMGYPWDTAGGLMTTTVVSVDRDQSVAGAIAAVRAAVAEDDPVDMVYVTDGEGRLVGHITLPRLIAAPEDMPAGMVMDDETLTVDVTDSDEDVARTLVHYNLTTVPVVDAHEKLLGVVGIDDVIDLFAPRAWRTRPRSAAV
jgi:CBS domain-containing protein